MKSLVFGVTGALLLLTGCQAASTSTAPESPATIVKAPAVDTSPATLPATLTPAEFAARMQALDAKGDYPAQLQGAREWQKSHPTDPVGVFAEANASYMLGEVDVSIAAWEKLIAMDPASASQGAKWLKTARGVRSNFPTFQPKPLQFQPGDATLEQEKWQQKGATLLAVGKYDEIERLAAGLQKSNAASVKGSPHLSFLLEGLLSGGESNFAGLQKRIAAWREARPNSNLARIAAIEMWTDVGWRARQRLCRHHHARDASQSRCRGFQSRTGTEKPAPERFWVASCLCRGAELGPSGGCGTRFR